MTKKSQKMSTKRQALKSCDKLKKGTSCQLRTALQSNKRWMKKKSKKKDKDIK